MSEAITFTETAPIFRIFDEAAAKAFYLDFLGFKLDWEHRFEEGLPLYAQVSRAGMSIHLSGHHGDGSPGASAFVTMLNIKAFQQELAKKKNPNMRPGIEELDWGLVMDVIDPFNNRIKFCQLLAS
jgi:catechol 2,3-dioxygenase-like lactoylglutathione lyase family enzyme